MISTRIPLVLLLAVVMPSNGVRGQRPLRNDGRSWPTLHGDLMRAGFYPHFPRGPLKLVWRKQLWQELTGTRCEVIVGGGLAFMGTYAGRMYAWDARTGNEKWRFQTGGPIGHSPMFDNGTLYFSSMDRKLYAVNCASGQEVWHFEAGEGFWSSPVTCSGLVMCGARDGVLYAVHAANGKLAWKFQTGDRILTSPSLSDDGQRIVFASEDMHVYCLAVQTGALLWQSRKLQGLSVRDHFPVIVHGLAIVTTNPVKDFHTVLGENQQMLIARTGFKGQDDRYIAGTVEDVRQEQDMIVAFLKNHPAEQTLYALNIADGKEPWIAPILYTAGLHNPPTPPCYNPNSGEVFVFLRSAYGVWDGGGEVRPYTAVGKLDLATGRVQLIEHSHKSTEAGRPAGRKDMPWNTFATIGDETQTLSCSSDYLFSNHQGALGSMDFHTGLTQNFYGQRDSYGGFYGPANFGWKNQGGEAKARQAGQPYGLVNEWHGPDKAIVSVAGNYVYYPTGSQVLCLAGSQ